MNKNKLWTRDFTIITLGSVISMLGNSVCGFAIGIMVLDYTDSVFLYALFMVAYSLPKLVMPVIFGPYLDCVSRKKVIYTLDFISAAMFGTAFILLQFDLFNYALFLFIAIIIGSIDSIYSVAYDSLYPNLVSDGNISKAYSISSIVYPLSALMIPVAAFVYKTVGLPVLFIFNAVTFLIAAIFETQIKANETHIKTRQTEKASIDEYKINLKEGIRYIRQEKGLLVITAYFFVTMLASSGVSTLLMPYFKANANLGIQNYTFVMAFSIFGRMIGGFFHYIKKLPTSKRFTIAMIVYFCTTVINSFVLFLPLKFMFILMFIDGFICVTSFNIRISATQSYVPDDHRARFNGAFQMLVTLGATIGQLIAGLLGDLLPIRGIVVSFMALNMLAVIFIMFTHRKHVKLIYNREL